MRTLRFLSFILLLGSLTSCMSYYETIRFEEDGSGTYEMMVDMSDMITGLESMSGMLSGLEGMGDEGFGLGDTEMEMGMGAMDTMMAMLDTLQLDTIITFGNLPAEARERFDNPGLMDRLKLRMRLNKDEGEYQTAFIAEFDRFEELNEMIRMFDRMGEEQQMESAAMFSGMLQIGTGNFWQLKRNKLIREEVSLAKVMQETMKSEDMTGADDEDMMGAMAMFMGGSRYRTEIHFPAKVRKVKIEGAEVKGNTVILDHSLMELMDEENDFSGFIRFKKTW